jgi:hypothetical protein
MGYFSLSVDSVEQARTILPETVQNDFLAYKLIFTPVNPAGSDIIESRTNSDLGDLILLNEGIWDLLVEAYMDAEANLLAAQGILEGIEISSGGTSSGNVLLDVIFEGEGTFRWTISFPGDVSTASMTITPISTGGTTVSPISLVSGSPGSQTLNSGYYRVVFTLTNNGGQTAVRRELLHVYQNMVSSFTHNFVPANFFIGFTLSDSVSINGNPWLGQELTANVDIESLVGDDNFQWKRNGVNITGAINSTYTVTALDTVDSVITVEVTRDGFNGSVTSDPVLITKAPGASVGIPVRDSVLSATSFSITAVTAPVNEQTVEYAINTDTTAPATGWQTSTTFTGLSTGIAYYVFARSVENTNCFAGTPSVSAAIRYYTVTFDGNGNTGGTVPAAQYVFEASSINLPVQGTLEKAGNTFGGWNTQANGNGDNYPADTQFTVTADITLYVSWTALTITINAPTNVTYTTGTSAITPLENDAYTERTATFTVAINGFPANSTDANNVGLNITPVTGFTFNGHNAAGNANASGQKTFTVTATYNGTTAFTTGSATLTITGLTVSGTAGNPSGYNITGAPQTITINIRDGQAMNVNQQIPVTTANIQHFNAYAGDRTSGGLSKHYRLTANVTAPSPWTPIGGIDFEPLVGFTDEYPFTGSFDGGNYTVSGLYIPNNDIYRRGFFGIISGDGTNTGIVRNLALTGVNIINPTSGGSIITTGGIAGSLSGLIENCSVAGTVEGGMNTGGLVGLAENPSTIQNSFSTANVSGSGGTGGIVGTMNGTVKNCYATGRIEPNGAGSNIGGLIGNLENNSTLENSYSTGTVSGGTSIGGLVGNAKEDTVIRWCYATGEVTAEGTTIGGLVGEIGVRLQPGGGNISNCVALNPKIQHGVLAGIGRVVGIFNSEATGTNNSARSDMPVPTGNYGPDYTANGKDGANVTIGTPLTNVFSGWSSSIWTIPAGNLALNGGLPTLQNMPAGAQNPTLRAPLP